MGNTCEIEALERRQMLTVIAGGASWELTGKGTLIVHGTLYQDSISITRHGNRIRLITANDVFFVPVGSTYTASRIKRVVMDTGDGNDQVHIAHDLLKHVTIQGGAGNDVIDGNAGSVLSGGGGNDRLFVPDPAPFGTLATIDIDSDVISEAAASGWNENAGPATLTGGEGDDTLIAAKRDFVIGGRGNDLAIQHILDRMTGTRTPGDDSDPEGAFGERASSIESFDVVVEKWTA